MNFKKHIKSMSMVEIGPKHYLQTKSKSQLTKANLHSKLQTSKRTAATPRRSHRN